MLITKIEPQKKNTRRVSVFIDENFAFGMKSEDVYFYKLREGMEISEEEYQTLLINIVQAEAKEYALTYLSHRMHSQKEVENYLRAKNFTEPVIVYTIEWLRKYNYIDDFSFARAFMQSCITTKKWGMLKIRYELAGKGIANHIIDEVLEEVEEQDMEAAVGLLEKKLGGNLNPDEKEKRRLYAYLLRRGFSYDNISAAFNEVLREP